MSLSRKTKGWASVGVFALALGVLLAMPAISQSRASNAQKQPAAFVEAKSQFAHGDLSGAETSLWSVLAIDPENEQALQLLGEIRMRQERLSEAEALFRRSVQIDPKSVDGHRNLGRTLVAEGKAGDALDQYKAASELAPRDVALKVELGRLYLGQGQVESAASVLATVPPAKLPTDGVPVKAGVLIATGKKVEAIQMIESARNSPSVELELAEVFLSAQLPDPAMHCLGIALPGLKHVPARFYYLKGRALAEKGNAESALSALQKAIDEDPKSADAFVAIAEIYSTQNKHAEAVADLKKAQILNPDSVPILRHLVVEATKAGDSKAAIDAASALSDKSPDNPDDLYLAGAAMLQENVQGASTVLEKYVTLRPENAKGWMALGIAYVQKEQYDKARSPLERAVALDSTLAEAQYQLGVVAKNEAKAPEAIEHLERALQLQPNHVAALRTLGNLYLQSGELEKAKGTLEHAEAIDANNLQTEYDLGLVCNKLGHADLARQHMERFRKLKEAQASSEHN